MAKVGQQLTKNFSTTQLDGDCKLPAKSVKFNKSCIKIFTARYWGETVHQKGKQKKRN